MQASLVRMLLSALFTIPSAQPIAMYSRQLHLLIKYDCTCLSSSSPRSNDRPLPFPVSSSTWIAPALLLAADSIELLRTRLTTALNMYLTRIGCFPVTVHPSSPPPPPTCFPVPLSLSSLIQSCRHCSNLEPCSLLNLERFFYNIEQQPCSVALFPIMAFCSGVNLTYGPLFRLRFDDSMMGLTSELAALMDRGGTDSASGPWGSGKLLFFSKCM